MIRGMIRGIVIKVTEGFIKLFSATGRTDESFDQREYFQHYGYTSRPLPGAEIIIIREGNLIIGIASDDRRYRISLEEGEVALYTDEGDKVHLKRGMIMEVVCGNKLTATVTNEVDITTKVAKIVATTSCDVTSPAVTVNASVSCDVTSPAVTVNAATSVILNSPSVILGGSLGTPRFIMDERLITWLLNHTHSGGATPGQALLAANVCTTIVKGA
jgi:phage gp45-like